MCLLFRGGKKKKKNYLKYFDNESTKKSKLKSPMLLQRRQQPGMGWQEFQDFNRQSKSRIPRSPVSEWSPLLADDTVMALSHFCELSSLSASTLLSKWMIYFSDSQSRAQTFLSATPAEAASSPPPSFSPSRPQNSFPLLHCHLS